MNIDLSISFIMSHGTVLEKARLGSLLQNTEPSPDINQYFLTLQNEDGGFPFDFKQRNLGTIDNTLTALWWLDELRLLTSPIGKKALKFLINVQKPDGGWDEAPAITIYDLPPWISPGDPRTRLYLSSYCAYWLAIAGHIEQSSFTKALDFLCKQQEDSGKMPGYLHSTWIATSVFLLAGSPYLPAAHKGLQYLTQISMEMLEASQIAWALDCLGRAGLEIGHPLIKSYLVELMKRQTLDGYWLSEDGDEFIVSSTIEAIKVL
jgi:hypothetical protein